MVLLGASTEAAAADGSVLKPRRSRYLLVVSLVLIGLALALGVGLGGGQVRTDQAQNFVRVSVPGVLTLHVAKPATYYVYSEGTACLDFPNCHGKLYPVTVSVTGPTGQPLTVQKTDGPTYMIGGSEGTGVARFSATRVGAYRVHASTGSYSEGRVAVGKDFPTWTQDWVVWFAMLAAWTIAALVAVLPVVSYRRRLRAAAGQPAATRSE